MSGDRGSVSVAAVAAVTALVAGGIMVALIMILHFVEPEYDPSWRMISEYSLGRHGWLMRIAFIAMAISPAATCVALWRSAVRGRSGSRSSRWGRSAPRSSMPIRSRLRGRGHPGRQGALRAGWPVHHRVPYRGAAGRHRVCSRARLDAGDRRGGALRRPGVVPQGLSDRDHGRRLARGARRMAGPSVLVGHCVGCARGRDRAVTVVTEERESADPAGRRFSHLWSLGDSNS